jgi:2-polyprenyl-6-methoxyphenol hydroxylase-like FAD-dependent oxidoreductase
MSSTKLNHVLIIGAGASGLASALALHALGIPCTVYESRATPSTIGGAVSLSPNALRCLDHLGVLQHLQGKGCTTRSIEVFSALSGQRIGELSFRNVDKIQYNALRIPRAQLIQGLLEVLEKTNVKIEYGKKLVALTESDESVEAAFEDGGIAKGDILLGCDGIHSNTRTKLVDPERAPVYSNTAAAYGMVPISSISSPVYFEDASINSSRRGSLLAAFCDANKQTLYFAAVMEVKAELDHEGWKAQSTDQETIKKEINSRFGGLKKPFLAEVVDKVEDVYFYPVYVLPPQGQWSSKRVMLLGDAAHAVCFYHFALTTLLTHHYSRRPPTEKASASH